MKAETNTVLHYLHVGSQFATFMRNSSYRQSVTLEKATQEFDICTSRSTRKELPIEPSVHQMRARCFLRRSTCLEGHVQGCLAVVSTDTWWFGARLDQPLPQRLTWLLWGILAHVAWYCFCFLVDVSFARMGWESFWRETQIVVSQRRRIFTAVRTTHPFMQLILKSNFLPVKHWIRVIRYIDCGLM